jgi:hypothetical protein
MNAPFYVWRSKGPGKTQLYLTFVAIGAPTYIDFSQTAIEFNFKYQWLAYSSCSFSQTWDNKGMN